MDVVWPKYVNADMVEQIRPHYSFHGQISHQLRRSSPSQTSTFHAPGNHVLNQPLPANDDHSGSSDAIGGDLPSLMWRQAMDIFGESLRYGTLAGENYGVYLFKRRCTVAQAPAHSQYLILSDEWTHAL